MLIPISGKNIDVKLYREDVEVAFEAPRK